MCPPRYFDVTYSINPWMDRTVPVDHARAMRQWEELVATYRRLGHDVEIVEPMPGAPDMVFSANGAIVDHGRVLTSRFRHPERCARAGAVPSVVRPRRVLRGAAGAVDLRRRRRHRVRGVDRAGGFRVPHQPGRPRRAAGVPRPAGGEPPPRRPALLPSRHRALRARRTHGRVLPSRVLLPAVAA